MLSVGVILLIALAFVLGALIGRADAIGLSWRRPGAAFWLEPPY